MDIWWTLHLKRDLASVPLARRVLLGTMESAGVDPQIAHDLGVALTEACANAVEHAGGGRPDECFQVTAALEGDLLRIEVVDSGPGLAVAPHLVPRLVPTRHAPAPTRPAGRGPRRRRGRASLPAHALALGARRLHGFDRPAPYDTHVLPVGRPLPAGPRLADLDTPPDPFAESGRGLFLIRALTDHVQLRNHPLRGAIVSFDKVLKRRGESVLRVAS
ncbi:ATP-binding protein [Kitasatospora sp. NPDC052896]|uniref:ATP-binding protein n=1 Tax=Kitasatospora sp. NPDC052896 TaxID=3364061 RepID=UPI0037CBB1D7